VLAALIGPYLAPYDFLAQDINAALQGPSAQHWFGTDELGRDIFSRLLYGARTAAVVALTVTGVSLFVGIVVGATAGLRGGFVDQSLMWLSDLIQSVPGLLLAMIVNVALRRPVIQWFDSMYEKTGNPFFLDTMWLDFVIVFGALALIAWPGLARLIRGQVLSARESDYVLAARAIGAKEGHIMVQHVIPNSMGPVIIAVTAAMGGAIVMESGLSFLGIGVQPPNASWGTMLANSLALWQSFPHLLLAPALTIGVIQVGFIFFGDGLNDALNPRQQD
jgi:ABC-type dipeptide/oligopeptide/nickel transport system permease subunit